MNRLLVILSRLGQAVPTVFGILVVTFLMTRALPGDPAAFFAGPAATPESIAEIRANLGLDKPLPTQFAIYLKDLARGDLGASLTTGQPVVSDLAQRLPASLELTLVALAISVTIAIPLGILAALHQDTWIDQLCRFTVTAGVSLPTFFTGLVLVYIFYFILGVAPTPIGRIDIISIPPPHVTGFYLLDAPLSGEWETAWSAIKQLILPSITLALFTLAPLARMTRAAMLQALGSEYIRTARACGLPWNKVLVSYALRNALLPVITTLGMVFSFSLGANVLVEKVFSWPGIGSYAIEALVVSDYAAVQGFVLSMAFLFVLLNLCVDIAYTLIDPRVKIDA
ncbi:MAG TPA: peptide ABC transporter permease [Burkholderiales bacterium]|jgi:peptide/nickel transport system permease protein|nr:peptide ABC transporter permease [Burkholderiales bacterium]